MSEITKIQVTERMSRIVIHNGVVYLCGQVGCDSPNIQEQAKTMLSRVDALLEEAGSSRSRMLSATVYLRDMKDFAEFNEIWDAWVVPGEPPARACVEARMARPNLLCEVSVVAALA